MDHILGYHNNVGKNYVLKKTRLNLKAQKLYFLFNKRISCIFIFLNFTTLKKNSKNLFWLLHICNSSKKIEKFYTLSPEQCKVQKFRACIPYERLIIVYMFQAIHVLQRKGTQGSCARI